MNLKGILQQFAAFEASKEEPMYTTAAVYSLRSAVAADSPWTCGAQEHPTRHITGRLDPQLSIWAT